MNYDKIILEMLSRIQTLEDEMKALRELLAAEEEPAAGSVEAKISTADIRAFIEEQKRQARLDGEESLTLRASGIHAALKLSKRYPMVCNAMRQCMGPEDSVVHETASGYSSSLEIRYLLGEG